MVAEYNENNNPSGGFLKRPVFYSFSFDRIWIPLIFLAIWFLTDIWLMVATERSFLLTQFRNIFHMVIIIMTVVSVCLFGKYLNYHIKNFIGIELSKDKDVHGGEFNVSDTRRAFVNYNMSNYRRMVYDQIFQKKNNLISFLAGLFFALTMFIPELIFKSNIVLYGSDPYYLTCNITIVAVHSIIATIFATFSISLCLSIPVTIINYGLVVHKIKESILEEYNETILSSVEQENDQLFIISIYHFLLLWKDLKKANRLFSITAHISLIVTMLLLIQYFNDSFTLFKDFQSVIGVAPTVLASLALFVFSYLVLRFYTESGKKESFWKIKRKVTNLLMKRFDELKRRIDTNGQNNDVSNYIIIDQIITTLKEVKEIPDRGVSYKQFIEVAYIVITSGFSLVFNLIRFLYNFSLF
ncbi:MAG: hypothetical protein ACTSQE_09990 [Candidatus Heimdallarchaeaceae archaeon]